MAMSSTGSTSGSNEDIRDLKDIVGRFQELRERERELRKRLEEVKPIRGRIVKKYVKCKKSCCKTGRGHGPYYYLVYYENGKQKWVYLKDVDSFLENRLEQLIKQRELEEELERVQTELKNIRELLVERLFG